MSDTPANAIKTDDPDFEMRRHQPGQPSLFPTEDLIVPESVAKMRKAVAAIHAVPTSAEHAQSLNSRRLFDGLIIVAQIDFSHRDQKFIQRVRDERIAPLFEVRISDLVRLAGIPGKNYERVHDELNLLYEMSFDWNIVGEDNSVIWQNRARLLSSLGIGKGAKRGLIRFSMDPDMLAIVLEPSLWASLSLQAMRGLATAASYALFQTAWRYVNTHAKVTAALPTQTWVELLVGKSRYMKEENGRTIVNYGEFKRRVLADAIQRVNEVPALTYQLKLVEHRQGNRVARLQFKFVAKPADHVLPLSWPAEIVAVLKTVGFSEKEIEDISQAHSSEVVADAIVRLKEAEVRLKAAGKSVAARKPYFHGILRNIAVGEDTIDHDKLEAEVRQEAAVQAADERKRKVAEGFDNHRRERFRKWVLALTEGEKEELIQACRESEESNPMACQMIERALRSSQTGDNPMLRVWLEKNRPGTLEYIFSNPEDKSIDAWMAWRLIGGDAIDV